MISNIFYCISTCSLGSEALLCGSELNLFLARGLTHDCAMSVRWEPEHKITLLVSTARFVDCLRQYLWSVHEPRKPPPNRTCEAELELFGWMAMPPPVNAHHWMVSQPKSSNSAWHVRVASRPRGQSTGFAWDKLQFGLWIPGGDFVFKFSLHTHRTIASQPPSEE